MMKLRYPAIFVFALSGLLLGCPEEVEPTPETKVLGHPFMFLTADRKAFILDTIQAEPMASIYADLQDLAVSELIEIDTSDWNAKEHGKNGKVAAANAFLAWLNDDEAAAQRALNAMAVLERNWEDHSIWGINIRMPAPLLHYTAAWDFLSATAFMSEEEANDIEEKLTVITDLFFEKYVYDEFTRYTALTVTQNNHPIRTACAIRSTHSNFITIFFSPNDQCIIDTTFIIAFRKTIFSREKTMFYIFKFF